MAAVFNGVEHFLGLLDGDGTLLEVNRASLELIDARQEDVVGRPLWETPWWSYERGLAGRVRRAVEAAGRGTPTHFEAQHRSRRGHDMTVHFSLTPVRDETGRVAYIIPEGRDVTAQRAAENARRETEACLSRLLEIMPEAIITIGETQRIEQFNKGAEMIFGYRAEEVLSEPLEMLLPEDARKDHPARVAGFAAAAESARYKDGRANVAGRHRNGKVFPAEASIVKLRVGGRLTFTAVLRDMTEQRRNEEVLRSLSFRDDLTGLYNRRAFTTLAAQLLRQAERAGNPCVLLFLDMNGFKAINDTHGHLAGDRVLAEVGALLRETFRESDLVARLGGDEFMVLAVSAGAESLALQRTRLLARVACRNDDPHAAFPISIGVGAAVFDPASPVSLDALIQEADAALYADKRRRAGSKLRSCRD